MDELTLEITYDLDNFDVLYVLQKLSSFTELSGGKDFSVAASAIPGWSPKAKDLLEPNEAKEIVRQLSQKILELETLIRFPPSEELLTELSALYRLSVDEVLKSFGNDSLSLGYADMYLIRYDRGYLLNLKPTTSRLGRFVMESRITRAQFTDFCRTTGAREAHWESTSNPDLLLPIWPRQEDENR